MLDLIERKKDESDRLTVAMAQGYVISMDAEYAAKWRAEHAGPVGPTPEAAQRQAASIGRLAAMFPGAVRHKVN